MNALKLSYKELTGEDVPGAKPAEEKKKKEGGGDAAKPNNEAANRAAKKLERYVTHSFK